MREGSRASAGGTRDGGDPGKGNGFGIAAVAIPDGNKPMQTHKQQNSKAPVISGGIAYAHIAYRFALCLSALYFSRSRSLRRSIYNILQLPLAP